MPAIMFDDAVLEIDNFTAVLLSCQKIAHLLYQV